MRIKSVVLSVAILAATGCGVSPERQAALRAAQNNAAAIHPYVVLGIDAAVANGTISSEFANSSIGPAETWAVHRRLIDGLVGDE